MKPGDLVFVRGSSWISKLVRFFDPGQFSHVGVVVNEDLVIEANWDMKSKIVPFYYKDYEVVPLDLTDKERSMVLPVAQSLEGRWYDYFQILSYVFRSRVNNPRYLICSELVYTVLNEIGYLTDTNLLDSTPNELYRYFVEDDMRV
jgi:cell wall-associated NlpC family hydrolase